MQSCLHGVHGTRPSSDYRKTVLVPKKGEVGVLEIPVVPPIGNGASCGRRQRIEVAHISSPKMPSESTSHPFFPIVQFLSQEARM